MSLSSKKKSLSFYKISSEFEKETYSEKKEDSGAPAMKKWKKKKKACPREDPIHLPQDVVYGALILTLTGHQEAYVENYRALLDYTENTIVIQGKQERIIIRGNDFLIQYFTNDDMKITGCISSVEYCNPKEQSNRW